MTLPLDIEYNSDLGELADLLEGVSRPGDYFVAGAATATLPGLTIEGVGRIAFPLLPVQAEAISKTAEQAPYGRGEDTLIDLEVRDVRQLAPDRFRLAGRSWPETLDEIVARAAEGLGCCGEDESEEIEAELYKLLLYEEGGFFVSHRDREKTPGMFATLVISLPSEHEGGDLVIRHGGREERVRLACHDFDDPELRFAAFFADCEHEVLPIVSGQRLCLVYNLLRHPSGGVGKPGGDDVAGFRPPDHSVEIDRAAILLEAWRQQENRPRKAAYLLEHQYTPESLSFSALKLRDDARARVLMAAAVRSRMTLHLGIVHIEEYGMAEVYADHHGRYRSKWDWDEEEEGTEDEDSEPEEYELIEAFDGARTIDEWRDASDRRVNYGPIPLKDGELFPDGALDGEPADKIRVTEATGNEGGSYERFYFRAALVFWPEEEIEDVLLEAGAAALVPHFERLLDIPKQSRADESIRHLAEKITAQWPPGRLPRYATEEEWADHAAPRAAMLGQLIRFGDPDLIARFVREVVVPLYHGSENTALCDALSLLPATSAEEMAVALVRQNALRRFSELVDWLALMMETDSAASRELPARTAAEALAAALEGPGFAGAEESGFASEHWRTSGWRTALTDFRSYLARHRPEKINWSALTETLVRFFETLQRIPLAEQVARNSAVALVNSPTVFPPDRVLCPLTGELTARNLLDLSAPRHPLATIWTAAANFLLERSGKAPAAPSDWTLRDQATACRCPDCRQLMEFARNPDERVARFPLNKERRLHLHRAIDESGMELRHETERTGRPYTLVLTKTRWRHEARLAEYAEDRRRMLTLARLAEAPGSAGIRELVLQLEQAASNDVA